jgi:tetratricopeptide (TPR) repeat protein
MLETIREYAAGKLSEDGEQKDAMLRAHCEYFFALSKQARDGMRGPEPAEWIQRLEPELDNVRAAASLSLSGAVDPFIAVKIGVALQGFWMLRGYITEGRALMRSALELPAVQGTPMAKAWALYVGATLAEAQSDQSEALEMFEACLALRRGLGNERDIAATLSTLSLARLRGGDTEGAEQGELEALKLFRTLGDKYGEAIGLLHLGQICHRADKHDEALEYLKQGLAAAQRIKNKELEGECQLHIGELTYEAGQFAEAENIFKRSLAVSREAADKRGEANSTRWLGKCELQRGARDMAWTRLTDALRAFASFELWEEALDCIEDLAMLILESEAGKSARLLSAVSQARERLQLRPSRKAEQRMKERLARLQEVLGEEPFAAAWDRGKGLDMREAIAEAQAPAGEPALV